MLSRIVIIGKAWKRLLPSRTFSTSTISDPYYILGVDKNADFAEIKKTFYKLAS
jgi:preprotein translocase subunit Sec63